MRRVVVLALTLIVLARTSLAADYSISLNVKESALITLAGVTAAYAVDTSIAEASPLRGAVSLTGLAPGSTQVMVVTTTGTKTIAGEFAGELPAGRYRVLVTFDLGSQTVTRAAEVEVR